MKHEYPFQVIWSPEDDAYLAVTMQLHGCMADGPTIEEAINNLRVVVAEWIEIAKEEGREIPKPWTIVDLANQRKKDNEMLQKQIEAAVTQAVETMLSNVMSQRSNPCSFRGQFVAFDTELLLRR